MARGLLLAGTLALVVTMPGCRDQGVVQVRGSKVTFYLDEYRIVPSVVRVRAGRIKIVARDTGVLTHNLKVESPHPDLAGNPSFVGGPPTAHPGMTVSTKLVLAPGRYRLVCTLGDHADLGQVGTLIVG